MIMLPNERQKDAANAACDDFVKECLEKGIWVCSGEWIAMWNRVAQKNMKDDEILSGIK